jgi:hypothetical protein
MRVAWTETSSKSSHVCGRGRRVERERRGRPSASQGPTAHGARVAAEGGVEEEGVNST